MTSLSRRQFLELATAATAASLLPPSLARAQDASVHTLATGWEFLRMPLASPFEVWSDQPLAPWSPVTLPHCFNAYDGCDPDISAYRGKGWYRTTIPIQNPHPGGRTLLHIEGAGQSSEVYLGPYLAGRHIGGYDEYVLDITDLLQKPGATNNKGALFSILCDNSPDMDRMPSDLSDFTLYGGLYRSVHLVYVPAVSIEQVHVHVESGKGIPATIKVEARLHNPTKQTTPQQLTLTIKDPGGKTIHTITHPRAPWAGTETLTTFTLPDPALWHPKTPHLYTCELTLGEAKQTQRFGIRFFEFQEHGPFLLNGERLLIQGTHRHEDHAGFAAATPASIIRQEMKMIREMGANFIRLAHYQQQRLVLDLCDELGLMVWEEVSWCRGGVGSEAFQRQGKEKLATMIDQHRNHPSIILWGLGNEDDWPGEYPSVDETAIPAYLQKLREIAHTLDPSRKTIIRRCDFARTIPDVYSPSIWAGWYGGRFIDYEVSLSKQRPRVKHLLHAEWGADNHAGRHAEDPYKTITTIQEGDSAERGLAYLATGGEPRVSVAGDWSESYACDLFDWHLKTQQSLPWLTGALQWAFKDFTTPLRPDNPVPRINQKGIVERDLTPKEGYYVFQSYLAEKPMARIYGHTWPVRWGKPNEPRVVKVYSNCPTAELFLNGRSLGSRKRDIQNFPAAGLRWDTPFVAGENHLKVIATTATHDKVEDEITFLYQTEPWGAPAKLTLEVVSRTVDKVTLEAKLFDVRGILCLEARNRIRYTLSGEGKLIDNQGTSTGSRVVELTNGRSRISLIPGKTQSTAAVASEGLPTAFCLI
jgi:beta-galactosidase